MSAGESNLGYVLRDKRPARDSLPVKDTRVRKTVRTLRRNFRKLGLGNRVLLTPPGMPRSRWGIACFAKVSVFFSGCFWCSCPVRATDPARNREWWSGKLVTYVARNEIRASEFRQQAGCVSLYGSMRTWPLRHRRSPRWSVLGDNEMTSRSRLSCSYVVIWQ